MFALWLICLLGGVLCGGVFVAGLLRDTHFGQVEFGLDLGRDAPWRGVDFRVWIGGPHVLWLTTLRDEPPFLEGSPIDEERDSEPGPASGAEPVSDADVEPTESDPDPPRRFAGRIDVRVLDPGHNPRLEESFDGGRLEHVAGGGMTWTRLGEIRLEGPALRPWRLEARVAEGDPAFEAGPGLRSHLLLRKDRPDVGMGGLINYVMVIPAGFLLLLSLGFALGLRRRGGSGGPAWISGALLAALIGLFAI